MTVSHLSTFMYRCFIYSNLGGGEQKLKSSSLVIDHTAVTPLPLSKIPLHAQGWWAFIIPLYPSAINALLIMILERYLSKLFFIE